MRKDIFVVLAPDGCLQADDMVLCQKEKWVPIAVLRQGEIVTVPCFSDEGVARKFGRRNYPKDWLAGIIALSLKEIKWMVSQGWQLEVLGYPKLLKDLAGFGYEILEFQSDPELYQRFLKHGT